MIDKAHYTLYLQQRGYADTTITSQIRGVHRFLHWIDRNHAVSLNLVTQQVLMDYLRQSVGRGCSPRTIGTELRIVWMYFNWLRNKRTIQKNPADGLRIKHHSPLILYDRFSSEELKQIYLDYKAGLPPESFYHGNTIWRIADRRGIIVLGLLVFQGLTVGEMNRIEPGDLDFDKHRIYIRKGLVMNARYLPLNDTQEKDMLEYLLRERILCKEWQQRKQFILTRSVTTAFMNLVKVLFRRLRKTHPQIRCSDHLRSSVIANWITRDGLRAAQYQAGHRMISTTQQYKAYNLDAIQEDISRYHPF